jgi:hypothetical protein
MKRIGIALAVALLAGLAFQAVGYAAGLQCTGADGKSACTAKQVSDLNAGIVTGKRMHKPLLMSIQSLTPRKAGGGLTCTQDNGSACTDEQIDAIISLASSTHSSDGEIHITKTMDKSSPMMMMH